jgi:hypothetical protein
LEGIIGGKAIDPSDCREESDMRIESKGTPQKTARAARSSASPDSELIALGEQFEIERRRFDRDPEWDCGIAMDKVINQISHATAKTIDGLGVKTVVALWLCPHFWDEPKLDMDSDLEHCRSVLEAACAVVGLPVPKEKPRLAPELVARQTHHGSDTRN